MHGERMNSAIHSVFAKNHYTWIAAYLRKRKDTVPVSQWEDEVLSLARALRDESRGFTPTRFLQACGYSRRAATKIVEEKL